MLYRMSQACLTMCLVVGIWQVVTQVEAGEGLWKRTISYQSKRDLFYNFQEGPNPSGTATAMYVSPVPVPPFVGHTYTTYQPLMPHEYLYKHTRSHYAHVPGSGWTRSKVRYGTCGLKLQDIWHDLHVRRPVWDTR